MNVGDGVYLDAAVEVDQRVLGDSVEQQCVQVRLVEHVRCREAVDAGMGFAAELGQYAVLGVEQA